MTFNRGLRAFFVIAAISMIAAYAHGAENPASDIKALLREIGKEPEFIEGEFTQIKIFKDIPKPLKSTGNFTFNQGELSWNQVRPIRSSIHYKDGKLSQSIGDQPSAQVTDQAGGFFDLISCIIHPSETCINQHFSVTHLQISQQHVWTLSLEPRSEMFRRAITSLTLDGQQSDVSELRLKQKDTETTIRFSKLKKKY